MLVEEKSKQDVGTGGGKQDVSIGKGQTGCEWRGGTLKNK